MEFVIEQAFGTPIDALVEAELTKTEKETSTETPGIGLTGTIRAPNVEGKVNKVLVAVAATVPSGVQFINEYFKLLYQ